MEKTGRFYLALAALLGAIVGLYWSGLSGAYLFDDETNIVNNSRLAITSLDADTLRAAAGSGSAGPLGRPLSMLSFALNHYFTAFDPFYFKLTNLGIHLLNTLLVFIFAHAVLTVFRRLSGAPRPLIDNPNFPLQGALLAATLWGVHPLNLTSVLYVVQRMTSLSALFGLAALAVYGHWRAFAVRLDAWRTAFIIILVVLLLAASLFSKESGALFLPLILFTELVIFRGKTPDGQRLCIGPLSLLRVCWLTVAVILMACLWKLPDFLHPESFDNRDFSLYERLLTESRVLFFYLRLFFSPSLSALGLYHDDFAISHGLWNPPATALAILGLPLITLATIWIYKKNPLWGFAWGWFLISHALESTVISLELVHEHRNYFATLGFALLIPWLLFSQQKRLRRLILPFFGIYLLFLAFITWQRAEIWGTPEEFAAFEAASHPHSARAQYQLGFTYSQQFRQSKDPEYGRRAIAQMRQTMQAAYPDNGAWIGIIHLSSILNEPIDPALLQQLRLRLRNGPAYNSNIGFLSNLETCQKNGYCHLSPSDFVSLFAAAIENPKTNSYARALLYQYLADYFAAVALDNIKAEEFLKDALAAYEDAHGHLLLAGFYCDLGRFAEARTHLARTLQLDTRKTWRPKALQLQKRIEQAERKAQSGKE